MECLSIGINSDKLDIADTCVDHAVDGCPTGTPDTYNFYFCECLDSWLNYLWHLESPKKYTYYSA
jgi:hypothetical protein